MEADHAAHLSIPALCRRLDVCRETVLAWIDSGELPAYDVASKPRDRRRLRVDPRDLDAFLLRRRTRTRTTTPPRRRRGDRKYEIQAGRLVAR